MSLSYLFPKSVMHIPQQNRQAASRVFHFPVSCIYKDVVSLSAAGMSLAVAILFSKSLLQAHLVAPNDTSTSITTTIIIHLSPNRLRFAHHKRDGPLGRGKVV